MTNQLEQLRALLDERGVEYEADDGETIKVTKWAYQGGHEAIFIENANGNTHFTMETAFFTAQQAVDATLGSGECEDAVGGDARSSFVCSECGLHLHKSSIGRSYVDEDGKRWYGTSGDHALNFCPNCGRKVKR